MRKRLGSVWLLILAGPLLLAACASQTPGASKSEVDSAVATANQAKADAEKALQTAQKAEQDAQAANQRADKIYDHSLRK